MDKSSKIQSYNRRKTVKPFMENSSADRQSDLVKTDENLAALIEEPVPKMAI